MYFPLDRTFLETTVFSAILLGNYRDFAILGKLPPKNIPDCGKSHGDQA